MINVENGGGRTWESFTGLCNMLHRRQGWDGIGWVVRDGGDLEQGGVVFVCVRHSSSFVTVGSDGFQVLNGRPCTEEAQ